MYTDCNCVLIIHKNKSHHICNDRAELRNSTVYCISRLSLDDSFHDMEYKLLGVMTIIVGFDKSKPHMFN